MVASSTEAEVKVPPPRSRSARWLAAGIAAALAAVYLAAITSTHAALSGGSVFWTAPLPAGKSGLTEPTAAEYADIFPTSRGYSQVVWANRPGGELDFGFDVHNGGPVPVTLLGVTLHGFDRRSPIQVLASAGAQLGAAFRPSTPFNPVLFEQPYRSCR